LPLISHDACQQNCAIEVECCKIHGCCCAIGQSLLLHITKYVLMSFPTTHASNLLS
jgi:hypothetical protein